MSDSQVSDRNPADGAHADMMSALFAQMVMQQSNLALMLLGKTPHPETGQVVRDVEGAKFFIDQLEMLELKTRGNLNKEETALLKQSLMALRMAFVDCVNSTRRHRSPAQRVRRRRADPLTPPSRPSAPRRRTFLPVTRNRTRSSRRSIECPGDWLESMIECLRNGGQNNATITPGGKGIT